jgi:hypothetical protein
MKIRKINWNKTTKILTSVSTVIVTIIAVLTILYNIGIIKPLSEIQSLPLERILDSTNKEGIKILVTESGKYKFTILEGAYTIYGEQFNKGWSSLISIFINKPMEFEDTESGPYPINEDTTIGFGDLKPTFNEAENIAKDSSIVRGLNQDDYIILVIPDSNYKDNSGSIKIRIEKVD